MKKIRQLFYYIIFLVICLVGAATGARGTSKAQETAISDHCVAIKESLRVVQRNDARARVYLGGKYETVLNKYVTPLNVRLVENNLSAVNLIESQNGLASNKSKFADDYVEYQQKLEELVAMDCKNSPSEFYKKLENVRQKRKKVEQDVQKIKNVLNDYLDMVEKMKETINAKAK